jgi:hypothetical protein
MYQYRGPWWNDIDRGKFLIRPPERSLVIRSAEPFSKNQEELGEVNNEFSR